MFGFFKPEIAYYEVYSLTPEKLKELGIKAVLFDIDNTIAPYEVPTPTQKMKDYFASLENAGIKCAFVSNNKGERVALFNKELGLFNVCDAKKPFAKGMRICIEHFGFDKSEVIAVGDQIYTDCMAAHSAGIKFVLVKPIQPVESWFFKLKRFLEKPFVRNLNWE